MRAKNMLYVDTSQSAITSTIGVMILPMFAVLFSHISGDFASLLTPPCVRGRQMLVSPGQTPIMCYHPQSNYKDNGS